MPFLVNSDTLSVGYVYDCSATGGSGFAADMISGSLANPGNDDESIANDSDSGGSGTVTIYPQNAGSDYFLQVSSPCQWKIVVQNG